MNPYLTFLLERPCTGLIALAIVAGTGRIKFTSKNTVPSGMLQAEEAARFIWGGDRLFTFVDPRKVASSNPGYCFKRAGWKPCGTTKRNHLLILEKDLW